MRPMYGDVWPILALVSTISTIRTVLVGTAILGQFFLIFFNYNNIVTIAVSVDHKNLDYDWD